MKIEVLYFEDCPNHTPAADRLRAVLRQEGLPGEVSEIEIKDPSAAKAWKFFESPTYTANLCPLWGRAEFASLGADFGEPIRNAVEAAPRRAIW
jgi:hypothetical protein